MHCRGIGARTWALAMMAAVPRATVSHPSGERVAPVPLVARFGRCDESRRM
jgi:hypothetical protein